MITGRMLLTECGVLGVFVGGLLVSRCFKRRWHATEIITMYAFGLLFELLTADLWNYHNIFLVFPFRVDRDISVLFPLGWSGLIMTATPIAEYSWRRWKVNSWWARYLLIVIVWLVIGGISETTFYNVGMIGYVHNESTRVSFILGQLPYLPPTMILAGYGLIPPLVSYFFRWMENGVVRHAGEGLPRL